MVLPAIWQLCRVVIDFFLKMYKISALLDNNCNLKKNHSATLQYEE